jgi:hypothetical protein
MTCHAYVLTRVGLDLMHLIGWVSIDNTHHHMEVLRKFLYLVFLVCGFFWLLQSYPLNRISSPRLKRNVLFEEVGIS